MFRFRKGIAWSEGALTSPIMPLAHLGKHWAGRVVARTSSQVAWAASSAFERRCSPRCPKIPPLLGRVLSTRPGTEVPKPPRAASTAAVSSAAPAVSHRVAARPIKIWRSPGCPAGGCAREGECDVDSALGIAGPSFAAGRINDHELSTASLIGCRRGVACHWQGCIP